jgi:peroxiredoxin
MDADCEACQFESEVISASSDLIGSKVIIYGVLRQDKEKIQDFIINHKINFPLLIDKDGKLFDEFKIECTPTNLIVKDGLIEKVLIGSPKDNQMLLKDLDISK